MNATTATRSLPTTCPFGERFGRRLPRGFVDEAAGLDWRTLIDTYAPSTDRFHPVSYTHLTLPTNREV